MFLFAIVFFSSYPYYITPVYIFPTNHPFKGNKLYNPYMGINERIQYKCNFHLHTYTWNGLTDGRKNDNKSIFNLYKYLGYNVACISNYQEIEIKNHHDKNFQESGKFISIPEYEHGYAIKKTHQICIGSNGVEWLDYPLYQGLSEKQFIINQLKQKNRLVALAHPFLREGYTLNDMKYLNNYDLIEVINHFGKSVLYLNAALSAGHLAFMIGSDDTHDISRSSEVGHCFTIVYAKNLTENGIISALMKGCAYVVDYHVIKDETYKNLSHRLTNRPIIKTIEIKDYSLMITLSQIAKEIRFKGQNNTMLSKITNTDSALYKIKATDNFVLTEIEFNDGSTYYLNPIFSYNGDLNEYRNTATIDNFETLFKKSFIAIIWLLSFTLLFFMKNLIPSRNIRLNNLFTFQNKKKASK